MNNIINNSDNRIQKDYRRNILAIIFNSDWKVLIWQNRWWGQDWTFPKWWIEKWESKEIALFREIYEEIWLKKDTLNIVYRYKQPFKKDFSQEEIQWKIKNKNEYYIWKKDYIFLISYNGLWRINLWITNELLCYKRIEINEIWTYIQNEKLLSIINIPFLKKKINSELFRNAINRKSLWRCENLTW